MTPRDRDLLCAVIALSGGFACTAPTAGAPGEDPRAPDRGVEVATGERYRDEVGFRRAVLERSLAYLDNGYARLRLERYAVPGAWEELPEQDPLVRPVGEPGVEFEPVVERGPQAQGEAAWSYESLLRLGRRAFESWPAQRVELLSDVVEHPALAERFGLWRDDRGRLGGVVQVAYPSGEVRHALTCASCHARPDEAGALVHGPASDIDLGGLEGGVDRDGFGAGKVDVTPDGIDNPVSIPDLRAVLHQRRLHATGNLHNGLAELAVRIETQLITANGESVRPARRVVFALALYIRALGAQAESPPTPVDDARAALFAEHCGTCHVGDSGQGDVVPADAVGTDPDATASPMRGTGAYRVPSLYRVAARTRLTHEGRFANLEAMFDPARPDATSVHPFGMTLASSEREALLGHLRAR